MQQAGHSFLLALPAMCAKQWLHAVAQSLQASIQSVAFLPKSVFMLNSLYG
jgi:hypothetical protein